MSNTERVNDEWISAFLSTEITNLNYTEFNILFSIIIIFIIIIL